LIKPTCTRFSAKNDQGVFLHFGFTPFAPLEALYAWLPMAFLSGADFLAFGVPLLTG
jgi:hypothetical protein